MATLNGKEILGFIAKGEVTKLEAITPHIGDNGNWFIGDTDTGVNAEGSQGPQGVSGEPALVVNIKNTNSAGATNVTPVVGTNYGWYGIQAEIFNRTPVIGDTFLGIFENTETKKTYITINKVINILGVYNLTATCLAVSEITGEQGIQGISGITPHIGDNGNWFIGDTDTGVNAEGTMDYTELTNKPTLNGVELDEAKTSTDLKLGLVTSNGGFQGGTDASATYGGAVGSGATTVRGGAVGWGASTDNGGAIGYNASATFGGAIGWNASTDNGGGAVGKDASANTGAAVGNGASATWGGAVGQDASATSGGAIGFEATTEFGGAVGHGAKTTDGFAGGVGAESHVASDGSTEIIRAIAIGAYAKAQANNACQLGYGTNTEEGTLQFRTYQLLGSDGVIPNDRLPDIDYSTELTNKPTINGVELDGDITLDIDYSTNVTNKPTINGVELDGAKTSTDLKLGLVTSDGGFIGGIDAGVNVLNGAALGKGANTKYGGAIGSAAATETGGAVGQDASTGSGGAVGRNTHASAGGAIGANTETKDGGAIGFFCKSTDGFAGGFQAHSNVASDGETEIDRAIAIGWLAQAQAEDACQLGYGTNTEEGTLQFRTYQLLGADGKIPNDRLPDINYSTEVINKPTINGVILDGAKTSTDLKLGLLNEDGGFTGGGGTASTHGQGGAIGCNASSLGNGFAGGQGAYDENGGGAVGFEATETLGGAAVGYQASATSGAAIGASARSEADGAVQLGTGSNTEAHTLQFENYQLLDAYGYIPSERIKGGGTGSIGITTGQTTYRFIFNSNISLEKMTAYLSSLDYDYAINGVNCVKTLVDSDSGYEICAINFGALGGSGYGIGVVIGGTSWVLKQGIYTTEYSDANVGIIQMFLPDFTYTDPGWLNTEYVLPETTDETTGETTQLTTTITSVTDNKIKAFVGTGSADTVLWDILSMF